MYEMDESSMEIARQFFLGKDKCPTCTQRTHQKHLIKGLCFSDEAHDPKTCLFKWCSLIATLDNWQNSMTPEQLEVWVQRVVNNIIGQMTKEFDEYE